MASSLAYDIWLGMTYARVMNSSQRPIPELVEERKALSAKLADINRRLEELDSELFSRLETALNAFGMWGPSPSKGALPPSPPAAPSRPVVGIPMPAIPQHLAAPKTAPAGARPKEIGALIQEHAAKHIKAAQRAMKTRELLELLDKDGVKIPGKDPMNNLSAHLSRSYNFTNTRDGWILKQEPPEGGS